MDQQIRVLVVDDDEPHAQAVAESLERVGYECVVATSGREGLRLIEEQTFDIVISDLIMDGVGGLEILAKAKRELPDAEVVILTGHGTIKTAVTAMSRGDHLPHQAARHQQASHSRRQGKPVAARPVEHRASETTQRALRI
ncbi:MAG: response regulator [Isosphaeraceae bacterium]